MGKDKDDDDDDDQDLTIRIGFPFSKSQAQQIIRSGVAVPSPFGVGNQTRVDASVRKSWQLEPHQVSFGDANGCCWETKLNSIVEQACQALGVTQQQQQQQNAIVVCAKLHKVLLYKEGGFFQPHVDSEKETGMFGTLAIQLPSCFQGGTMVFEHHAGIKERVPLDETAATSSPESSLMWLAWYADCLHEVTPITFGHRLVLVYNLILTTAAAAATAVVGGGGDAAGVDEDEKADPNDKTTTTTPKPVLPYTVSPSDVSDLQCLVDEWKQRIQQRLLLDDNVMPQRDDLKWLEKDFVNDICFVHRLDHRYTLPGWSACDFYNELFYGFDSTIDKFHTIVVADDDDGNATNNKGDNPNNNKAGEQLMRGVQSLKGRDRNLVELLSKANGLEMTLVLQDFRDLSNFEEDMQLVVTKQVNGQDLPLWNIVPTTIDLVDNHDDTNNERTTRTTTNDNDNFRLVHFDSPLTGVYQQPKDTFYRLPPCTFFSWDTLFQGEQQFRALNVPSIEYIGNEGQFGESLYRMAFLIIRPKLGTKPAFGII